MSYKHILDAEDCKKDPENHELAIDCAKYSINRFIKITSENIEKCKKTCPQNESIKENAWRSQDCLPHDQRCHYEKYVLAKLDSFWDKLKAESDQSKKFYYYIYGPPGAGKSTIVDNILEHYQMKTKNDPFVVADGDEFRQTEDTLNFLHWVSLSTFKTNADLSNNPGIRKVISTIHV